MSTGFPDIPGFKVMRLLGRGGMGAVYLADDLTLGRKVAIKILAEKYNGDSEARDRFLREARSLAGIDHPNVLRIHSMGEARDIAFIVMEYVDGQSLAHRIAKGPMPADEVLRIARQAAAGLSAAWDKGIVHRDVKPSNILLDSGDQVRVADFGLAKPIHVDSGFETSTGVVLGTPRYISPEQARGEALDFRSDVYSLGVALYELASGKHPFASATPVEVLAHHLHSPMPALPTTTERLAPALQHAIARMTQKRPADRPGSYKELSELLEGKGEHSRRDGLIRYALAALGIAALVGGATFLSRRDDPKEASPPSTVAAGATYDERSLDVPPKYLSGGTADSLFEFAPDARGKEGCLGTVSVLVEFVVTSNGDVTELEVKNSKRAVGAMLGVSRRKYSPALKEGVQVRARMKRRYGVASYFLSLASLRAQVGSIEKGEMPAELAVGCVDVLARELRSLDPATAAEAVRGLTSIPRAYAVDAVDLDSIGWILAESGHSTEAMQIFEARLARLPETAPEYERIADGYAAIGQRDAAVKAYRLALALEPGRERLQKKVDAIAAGTAGTYLGAMVYAEADVDLAPRMVTRGMPLPRPSMPPGESCTVALSFVVTQKGENVEPAIHRSGCLEVEQYMSDVLAYWRYEPGKKDGRVVPVKLFRTYTFAPKATAMPTPSPS